MKKLSMMLVVLSVVTILIWSISSTQATAVNAGEVVKTQSPSVAVVDIAFITVECQANISRHEQIAKRADVIEAEIKKYIDIANGIKDDLKESILPDTPEAKAKLKEFYEMKAKVEAINEYHKKVITSESDQWVQKLYEKILIVVKEVAAEEGVSLVINKELPPALDEITMEKMIPALQSRSVLYNTESIDLTSKVMKKLNEAYASAACSVEEDTRCV